MRKKFVCLSFALLTATATQALNVTVDPSTRHQTIDGFGAGSVYYQNWLTENANREEIYDTMFTALGLSLLRVGNWNQVETSSLANDSAIVAEGKERLGSRMRILMSSWSAPASLKANNLVDAGSSTYEQNTLKKVGGVYVYDQFASWWRRSLERYQSVGIEPDYITIQNEPDMNTSYASMILLPSAPYTVYPNGTATSVNTAVYGQALKAVHDTLDKLPSHPAILGPEVLGIGYSNFRNYIGPTDTSRLDGYAFHLYHGNDAPSSDTYAKPDGFNDRLITYLSPIFSTKPTFMTEFCPMRDPKPSDMVVGAQIIQNLLTKGQVNGYISWELTWKENGQAIGLEDYGKKESWTTAKGYLINPEYHTLRHYSKFVTPGWDRVQAISPDTNLRVVAFANNASDSLTLVAINIGTSAQTMNTTIPSGFKVSEVWQSQTQVVAATGRLNDALLSKKISSTSTQSSWSLPDSSITTIVWVKNTVIPIRSVELTTSQPTQWRVYDAMGHQVGTFASKPRQMPRGVWMLEALDNKGNRLFVQRVRF